MFRRTIACTVALAAVLGFLAAPSRADAQSRYRVPTTPIPVPVAPLPATQWSLYGPSYFGGDSLWLSFAPGYFHGPCHYEVLIRHGCHWDVYATVREARDAERLARRLRLRGHEVRIRQVVL